MSQDVVLLEHLFHRDITPVHVAKWLIPRFVSSNLRLPTSALSGETTSEQLVLAGI